jgi:N-acetylmuramoyl-L-alanine amidase
LNTRKAASPAFPHRNSGADMRYIIILLMLLLTGCGENASNNNDGLQIKDHKLPYWQNLTSRSTDDLNMVVIHATELTDMAEAREYGERVLYEESGTGASGHYYIDRDGSIEQYVPDYRIANHTSGWNKKTISIELINLGRYPDWFHTDHQVMKEPYPDAQIDALIKLVNEFKLRYPTIEYTEGHEDLDRRMMASDNDPERDVPRKMDPGEHFPWHRFIQETGLKKEAPMLNPSEGLVIKQNLLDYWQSLEPRETDELDLLVIHATEQPDWPSSRAFAEEIRYENRTGAAGHYYIDRAGNIEQYVPDERRSNHTSGWNARSLSVELINTGRYPNATHTDHQEWKYAYPDDQIDALIGLIAEFKRRYPTLKYVQGHGDLDKRLIPSINDPDIQVRRRIDPGGTFPWDDVITRSGLSYQKPAENM